MTRVVALWLKWRVSFVEVSNQVRNDEPVDLLVPHSVLLDVRECHEFTICRLDWNRKSLTVVCNAAAFARIGVSAVVEQYAMRRLREMAAYPELLISSDNLVVKEKI